MTEGDNSHTTTYVYDSQDQLIRENNEDENYTHTWAYNAGGNITQRNRYSYTSGEQLGEVSTPAVVYTYGEPGTPETPSDYNEQWDDLLRQYGTKTVTYDQSGNPETFGARAYTWEHGRQLKSLEEGNTTWNYTYDANGMRTGRTDGTTTYQYIYTGSQLTQMTVDGNGDSIIDDTLTFTYDAAGTPLTVTLNGTRYYYAVNVQGDVVAILNSGGTAVAYYGYDAWGNALNSYTSDIGFLNPLRYRSYVYDTETKLYYLQSRYYDPEVGRFINADVFAATGQGFVGNNMFSYCLNAPVCRIDIQGRVSEEAAEEIIEENAEEIKEAGEEYGVDPVIIACCIYAEQVLNVDWKDRLTDYALYFLDTSVGIGQVKISTAKMLEDHGYIEKTSVPWYYIGRVSRRQMIASKLQNPEANIRYVAAYLRVWQDAWSSKLDISNRPEILGTLYNLGKNARLPNFNPKPNAFGEFVKENYDKVKAILYKS